MSDQPDLPDPQAVIPGQSWVGKLNPGRTQVVDAQRVYDTSKQALLDDGWEDFSLLTSEVVGIGQAWDPVADAPVFPPADPPVRLRLTEAQFDDLWATALGEVVYDDVLEALETVAAKTPKDAESVQVKRALRAKAAATEFVYPWSLDTADPASVEADDLVGRFLLLVIAALTPTDAAIQTKVISGLTAWPTVGAAA